MVLSQKATIQEYSLKFLQKSIKYLKSYTIFIKKSEFCEFSAFLIFKTIFKLKFQQRNSSAIFCKV